MMPLSQPGPVPGPEPFPTIQARCPSCGAYGSFTFGGEQHWPPHIARQTNMPSVVRLWHCDRCKSTMSERDLLF